LISLKSQKAVVYKVIIELMGWVGVKLGEAQFGRHIKAIKVIKLYYRAVVGDGYSWLEFKGWGFG
jgi:hypothetical protein